MGDFPNSYLTFWWNMYMIIAWLVLANHLLKADELAATNVPGSMNMGIR